VAVDGVVAEKRTDGLAGFDLDIAGMTCASCAGRVERALSSSLAIQAA
jgi:Heavy-metal-associated domain